jgi:hypothetical protein
MLESIEPFVWGVLATDAEFGPDGSLYVLDWIEGTEKTGRGRIWRVSDPKLRMSPGALSTKRLLGEGMRGRAVQELPALLGHPDMRVRQEAQLELAGRGAAAVLRDVALRSGGRLSRLHALWGGGQALRSAAQGRVTLDRAEAAAHVRGDPLLHARLQVVGAQHRRRSEDRLRRDARRRRARLQPVDDRQQPQARARLRVEQLGAAAADRHD